MSSDTAKFVLALATLALAACGRSLPVEPAEIFGSPGDAGSGVLDGPIVCARAQLACDGGCVDPRSDRAHCGAVGDCTGDDAGQTCGDWAHCVDGACIDSCPDSHARCDGACTNGAVDPQHCGARGDCTGPRAGVACPADQVCSGGVCMLACPAQATYCDGRCIDPAVDRMHCGARDECSGDGAGQRCGAAEFCVSGSCSALCPGGSVQCDGQCIDPLRDARFCGADQDCSGDNRGVACPPQQVCFDGVCTDGCPPDTIECDGRCIDPDSDPIFCGAGGGCGDGERGVQCPPDTRCNSGSCQLPCAPPELRCGDVCVDPRTDPMFCGASGNCSGVDVGVMCLAGEVCDARGCQPCADGRIACDDACIDPQTHREFCGASGDCNGPSAGTVCDDAEACVDGVCSGQCPDSLVLCDGQCIDPLVDRAHCGAIGGCQGAESGQACTQGQLCDLGQCVLDCPAGLLDCDGTCIQPDADPLHCGAFGDCQGGGAGTVCEGGRLCSAGACVDACGMGQSLCVGGCVELSSDRNNCGSCRQRCAPQESCIGGSCQCPAGLDACEDACFDLQSSALHCGGCGNPCLGGKRCAQGRCACAPGLADCGDHCANLATDEDDCGGCGIACRLFEACSAGQCTCQGNFTRCDRGCTDTGTDARHCGGCGIACGEGERCSGGQCDCEPGFVACAGSCVDTRHDTAQCGGCGVTCAAGEQCLDGVCGCGPGHALCDGACRDLSDSTAHCGACDNDCGAMACAGGSCRCTLYVDAQSGNDQASGDSWGSAVRTLRRALEINGNAGCAIWVTGGTHYPTAGQDRMATFELLGAVAIYGGFVGGESDPAQRRVGAPETVLSGDLGLRGQTFDNSYHVVHCDPVDGCRDSSVLDGITIEGGNANGTDLEQRGGGLYCRDAMPTLRRVVFRNNEALFGGALFSIWGEMRATDCTFEDNRALDGGALYILRAAATMTRVRFLQNRSQARGGAVTQSVRAGLDLSDCVLRGNRSLRGGGIYGTLTDGEPVTVDGTIFMDNVASAEGGGIYCGDGWTLTDSQLLDNRALDGAGIHGPANLRRTRFEGNTAANSGGGMLSRGEQPAMLSECTWVDNTARVGGGLWVMDGTTVVDGGLFERNSADDGAAIATGGGAEAGPFVRVQQSALRLGQAVRGGAVFAGSGSAVNVVGSLLEDNVATDAGGAVFAGGATVELRACELQHNAGGRGGGIHSSGARIDAINSVLWRNTGSEGAGVFAENSAVELLACTVVDNEAGGPGGGVRADLATSMQITGSILWGNLAGGDDSSAAQYAGDSTAHITYSDIQGGCPLQSCTDRVTGNLSVDPQFVDRAGGDLRLQPPSQCIDAGDNDALEGIATDLEGGRRIVDGPDPDGIATADMGALEYAP